MGEDPCPDSLEKSALVRAIAGRDLISPVVRGSKGVGRPVMEVTGLSGLTIEEISFTLAEGEILGVTGLTGSGQESVSELISGRQEASKGKIRILGTPLEVGNIHAALAAGIACVPGDREALGIFPGCSIRENISLSALSVRRPTRRIRRRAESNVIRGWIDQFDISPKRPSQTVEVLSGGNQQKVVVARALETSPNVLLLDQPTQGVDISARDLIHRHVKDLSTGGMSILVCSDDLNELVEICDRVLVMVKGLVVREVPQEELTEHLLLEILVGDLVST